MSHFTVCVVTKEFPTQELIAETLQPFHEFGCTGTDDQYVQNLNITEEDRKEYLNNTTKCYRDKNGKLLSRYNKEFFRDPTPSEAKEIGFCGSGSNGKFTYNSRDWGDGKGYRAKVKFMPDGYEEVEVKVSELKSFKEWEIDWGRPILTEDEIPDLSDEHKYGWCRVDKNDEVIEVINRKNPNYKWDWWVIGGRWENSIYTKNSNNPGDSARKSDIDFDRMIGDFKRKYGNENYIFSFAYLIDGKWIEQGEMGWWGAVHNEDDNWATTSQKILDEIPDDHYLTIVDCHI